MATVVPTAGDRPHDDGQPDATGVSTPLSSISSIRKEYVIPDTPVLTSPPATTNLIELERLNPPITPVSGKPPSTTSTPLLSVLRTKTPLAEQHPNLISPPNPNTRTPLMKPMSSGSRRAKSAQKGKLKPSSRTPCAHLASSKRSASTKSRRLTVAANGQYEFDAGGLERAHAIEWISHKADASSLNMEDVMTADDYSSEDEYFLPETPVMSSPTISVLLKQPDLVRYMGLMRTPGAPSRGLVVPDSIKAQTAVRKQPKTPYENESPKVPKGTNTPFIKPCSHRLIAQAEADNAGKAGCGSTYKTPHRRRRAQNTPTITPPHSTRLLSPRSRLNKDAMVDDDDGDSTKGVGVEDGGAGHDVEKDATPPPRLNLEEATQRDRHRHRVSGAPRLSLLSEHLNGFAAEDDHPGSPQNTAEWLLSAADIAAIREMHKEEQATAIEQDDDVHQDSLTTMIPEHHGEDDGAKLCNEDDGHVQSHDLPEGEDEKSDPTDASEEFASSLESLRRPRRSQRVANRRKTANLQGGAGSERGRSKSRRGASQKRAGSIESGAKRRLRGKRKSARGKDIQDMESPERSEDKNEQIRMQNKQHAMSTASQIGSAAEAAEELVQKRMEEHRRSSRVNNRRRSTLLGGAGRKENSKDTKQAKLKGSNRVARRRSDRIARRRSSSASRTTGNVSSDVTAPPSYEDSEPLALTRSNSDGSEQAPPTDDDGDDGDVVSNAGEEMAVDVARTSSTGSAASPPPPEPSRAHAKMESRAHKNKDLLTRGDLVNIRAKGGPIPPLHRFKGAFGKGNWATWLTYLYRAFFTDKITDDGATLVRRPYALTLDMLMKRMPGWSSEDVLVSLQVMMCGNVIRTILKENGTLYWQLNTDFDASFPADEGAE